MTTPTEQTPMTFGQAMLRQLTAGDPRASARLRAEGSRTGHGGTISTTLMQAMIPALEHNRSALNLNSADRLSLGQLAAAACLGLRGSRGARVAEKLNTSLNEKKERTWTSPGEALGLALSQIDAGRSDSRRRTIMTDQLIRADRHDLPRCAERLSGLIGGENVPWDELFDLFLRLGSDSGSMMRQNIQLMSTRTRN